MHPHRSQQRAAALSATFDFWHAPSTVSGGGCVVINNDVVVASPSPPRQQQQQHQLPPHLSPVLPAPHAQLLLEGEHPSFVVLKGQDHRQEQQRQEENEEESDEEDDEEEDDDNDIDMLMESVQQVATTQGRGPPLPHNLGERRSSSWIGGSGGGTAGAGTRRPSWLLGFARTRSDTTLSPRSATKMSVMTPSRCSTTSSSSETKLLHLVDDGEGGGDVLHSLPPGLVRIPSGSSSDGEDSSSTSSGSSGGGNSDDDSSMTSSSQPSKPKGVSFSLAVKVQPIPHSCLLSHSQRLRMYTSSEEVRKNKIRNKMEYRHDGYDWRNVSEEWEMGVDMVTGELVHPVHELNQQQQQQQQQHYRYHHPSI